MKKRYFSGALIAGALVLSCAGCGSQKAESTAPISEAETEAAAASEEEEIEVERTIDVCLNGYEEVGGLLSFAEADGTGGSVTNESGSIGILAAEGETIENAMEFFGWSDVEPVLEGDTFEGWLEYTEEITVDESGFESVSYELITDKMYTTDQLMAMTVPDHAVNYVAKWSSIPVEEYFRTEIWEDAESSGSFSFSANGGAMTFYMEDGSEYDFSSYTYWLEDGQALNDIMGTEYGAGLIDVKKEGAEFAGWTLYEADSAFWSSEETEEDGMTCFLYDAENMDAKYLIMKNAVMIREASPTEELCGMSVVGKCYYAEANWK